MADSRLLLEHLMSESLTCQACGAPTFVMLHHWQGGNPEEVLRSLWCSASTRPVENCLRADTRSRTDDGR